MNFCFEIFNNLDNRIALIQSNISLTNKQMGELMDIFKGSDNSESWYEIKEVD